ncbi:YuiA family protein [Tepidibacillus fermentans]|uniref:Uncharacterized protein n=1 Tax=Tepidibacillus fermentans TaxID=1281767 RepID=A0A4R3KIE0_9BACI|nr:YuiA family protein [Tepidibacillus fermentans]TCS83129.1 hypothetical protein EDD72_10655 [Tepidibacillus fermentans]
MVQETEHVCGLCDGQGYHVVMVGGTETCPACDGLGVEEEI